MMKKKSAVFFVLLMAIACLMLCCFCACKNGNNGSKGNDGKGAYEIWLEEGHTGSQSDFLAWLKGDDGNDGNNGNNGKSAYEIWLEAGSTGSQADFLAWLKGDDGNDGNNGNNGKSAYEIWLEEGHTGSQADFLAWLKGGDGNDGNDGTDGNDGKSAYEIWLDIGFVGTEMDFFDWLRAKNGNSDNVSGDGSMQNPWIVSTNVEARLAQKEGGKYKLYISGSGNMQSWSSAEDVPWYSVGDKIDEISIGSNVTGIGDYAFSNVALSSLIIPENITSIGEYALPSQSTAYIYPQTTVAAEQNDEVAVKVYSAEIPATHDRHWTSWGSTGNITDEPFNDVQYWHYGENNEIVEWNKIKVLFIGNSFTFYYQIPKQFDAIAENLGYYVETYSIAVPSQTLETHAVTTSNSGTQITALLNAVNDFDYIVLQEQSTRPYTAYNAFFNAVQKLKTQINATQDHAKIYLYETWGSPASAGNSYEQIAEMEQKLYEAYTRAADELQLDVSYVGRAFTYIKGETDLNLYYGDNRHPGPVGSYLSACVHVASMLGGDVRNCTLTGEDLSVIPCEGGIAQKMNLTEEQCEVIRAAAYTTVFESEDEKQTYTLKLWYEGTLKQELTLTVGVGALLPVCEVSSGEKFGGWTLQGDDKVYAANMRISYTELSEHIQDGVVDLYAKTYQTIIAVWGRWISEDNFKSVMEGFKTYCEENSLQYDKVGYIYYDGKTSGTGYFAIADFTAQVKKDDVDIMFPVGNDINERAESEFNGTVLDKKAIGEKIENSANRYIAKFTADGVNELADEFYAYITTDEAKEIFRSFS